MTRRHIVHGAAAAAGIASLGIAAASTLGGAAAATVSPSAVAAPLSTVAHASTTALGAAATSVVGQKGATATRATTTTTVVPAPAANASATGVHVGIIDTCISCTTATAGPSGGKGTGTAVRVLGTDLAAGQSTGALESGALLAIPLNPVLTLAVADWEESVRHAGGGTQSHARTALVDLNIGAGQVLTVTVLQSISDATWTQGLSTGHASNDGAIVNLGNGALVVVLLHSEAGSDGTAHAYVASINGNELLPSSSAGIPIAIPGVTTITLLQAAANGGAGSALIAQVSDTVVLGAGENVLGLGAQASGAHGSAPAPQPAATPAPPVAPVTGIAPSVPNTGTATAAGLGVLLLGVGAAVSALGRRRRRSRWITAKD